MREEITEREGPLDAHRPLYDGLTQHDHPWALPKAQRGAWAEGLGVKKFGVSGATTLLYAGCSADRASGRSGAIALAKLMQRAGEDFVILGSEEKCCGLYAFDLGFRREYERLQEANLATIRNAGIKKVVVACGSCQRIWREYAKTSGIEVVHGVEYVDQLNRTGRLKFSTPLNKKVTYHDSAFTIPREIFCARFLESSWSRWHAINDGLGVAVAVVVCRKQIQSWRNGARQTACARRRKPVPR